MDGRELPTNIRKLRSCIACGLIQTTDYWEGSKQCPNCHFEADKPNNFTSACFTGVIAIFEPSKSWCASWQRYEGNIPGMYALNNEGEVTQDILRFLEDEKRPLPEWVERYKLAHSNE